MTIAADVKQCLASLKGAEASLSSLALRSEDQKSAQILHESVLIVSDIVTDLKKRVELLESEEFQYKGS